MFTAVHREKGRNDKYLIDREDIEFLISNDHLLPFIVIAFYNFKWSCDSKAKYMGNASVQKKFCNTFHKSVVNQLYIHF